MLTRLTKDKRVLNLLECIIAHTVPGHSLGKGIPVGNLTSQRFVNLYLGEMDHFVKETLRVEGYLRYMDGFLFFGQTKSILHGIQFDIMQFLHE